MTAPSRSPEKQREYQRRYRERHPERVKANDRKRNYTKEWAAAHPEAAWAYRLKRAHKMTPLQYEQLWEKQGGCCYLCGDELVRGKVHIDHDHDCCPEQKSCPLCRRGLACRRCNWVIGWCDEDPDKLRRIADSLQERSLPR